jgi:hypothetical protein
MGVMIETLSSREAPAPAIAIEAMFVTRLQEDIALEAVALGGIYAYTSLGHQGIHRDATPEAYDVDGYLLPIIICKARSPIPSPAIYDPIERVVGQSRVVEFWMYQWVGYDIIEVMDNYIFTIMQSYKFLNYYPTQWMYTTGLLVDPGSLNGASMMRSDYLTRKLRRP